MSRTANALNVGVVGATGLVGELFLRLLEERNFPLGTLKLFASDRSKGQTRTCLGQTVPVEVQTPEAFKGLDIVFFSSGDDISKEWAPIAAKAGAVVIDNSAAFRTDPDKLLCVPEVNGHLLGTRYLFGSRQAQGQEGVIIANPNCSTIQLVCALHPLHRDFGLESVHVATYQAVSGGGKDAQNELSEQTKAWAAGTSLPSPQIFPHQIAMNAIPQIGSFQDNGFCTEEIKIMRETKKIMGDTSFRVSAFTVRIPAWNAHSEVAWVRIKKSVEREQILNALSKQSGLILEDDIKKNIYPTAHKYSDKDGVAVGRIHRDLDDPNTWILWIVSDNLRKGAALNGIQIAERIFDIAPRS